MGVKRLGALVAISLSWACNTSPPITALTERDCPEGAKVVGQAPPAGFLQRCELGGGTRHGLSRAWYKDGRLRYETEWWHGVKHGKFTLWHPNGQKRAEGQDRYGMAEGTWTSWAEDGGVEQRQVFRPVPTSLAAEPPRTTPKPADSARVRSGRAVASPGSAYDGGLR